VQRFVHLVKNIQYSNTKQTENI